MRVHATLAVAAISLLAVAGCSRHKTMDGVAPPYPGTYGHSCRHITKLTDGYVSAECAAKNGQFKLSYLKGSACQSPIANDDGMMVCEGATATTTPPGAAPAASDTAAASSAQ